MPEQRRTDETFESALADTLRRQQGAGDDCPEPERLAAFWDRSLAPEERVRFEAHAAQCTRCQASLAALARTADVGDQLAPETTAHGLAWLLDWRWVTPVATVAVVMLAVWVIEPESPTERPVPAQEAAELANRETRARTQNESADSQARRDDVSAPTVAEERVAESSQDVSRDAPNAAAPADRSRVARRDNTIPDTEAARLNEIDRLEPQSTAATAAARDDVQRRAETERPEAAAERRLAFEALPSRGIAVSEATSVDDAGATVVIASPTASVVWRLPGAGVIEQSTDGGSTWVTQLSDETVELAAGSAPTASICWVVGRAGLILRATNGRTWERLPSPVAVDFVAIEAADALNATVTASDGTHYRTSDAGDTWRQP